MKSIWWLTASRECEQSQEGCGRGDALYTFDCKWISYNRQYKLGKGLMIQECKNRLLYLINSVKTKFIKGGNQIWILILAAFNSWSKEYLGEGKKGTKSVFCKKKMTANIWPNILWSLRAGMIYTSERLCSFPGRLPLEQHDKEWWTISPQCSSKAMTTAEVKSTND